MKIEVVLYIPNMPTDYVARNRYIADAAMNIFEDDIQPRGYDRFKSEWEDYKHEPNYILLTVIGYKKAE